MSVLHNPPTPVSKTNNGPPQLSTAFPASSAGAASTSASLASPITPFSQSALPSKSLLSREDSNTFDPTTPGGGNAGVAGSHPSPMILQRNVQKNLQATIRRIFESCYESGNYKQVVGIAIEARNLEVLRSSILRASQDEKEKAGKKAATGAQTQSEELMEYVLDICMNVVQERGLRNEVRWNHDMMEPAAMANSIRSSASSSTCSTTMRSLTPTTSRSQSASLTSTSTR